MAQIDRIITDFKKHLFNNAREPSIFLKSVNIYIILPSVGSHFSIKSN